MTLEVGDRYKEPGATATDNVDGDITDKIITSGKVDTSKKGTYQIKYIVKDSAGNLATAIRTVVVVDAKSDTPPTIKLEGPEEVYITVGDRYIEYGATATDKEDGELPVSINKKVDTSKEGKYIIKYTATDSDGNSKTVSRTVVVQKAERGKVELPMTPVLSETEKKKLLDAVNSIRTI